MNSLLWINPKRFFTLIHLHYKNYYDALGVTPKATQADIKAAYYKLSMVYHPDRNQGCKSSAEKFQAITAAYEILGDYKKRKLYDRGLVVDTTVDPKNNFRNTSSSIVQKTRPVKTGPSPIYNYDEWSKAHYGQSFARKNQAREDYKSHLHRKSEDARMDIGRNCIVLLMLLFSSYAFYSMSDNEDSPMKNNRTK